MEGPAFLHLKHYAFNIILQQHGLQGFISFMAITAQASANWSGPSDGGRVGWVAEWQLDKQRSPRSPTLGPVLLPSLTAAAVPSVRGLQECGGPWLTNLLSWLEERGTCKRCRDNAGGPGGHPCRGQANAEKLSNFQRYCETHYWGCMLLPNVTELISIQVQCFALKTISGAKMAPQWSYFHVHTLSRQIK